MARMKLERRDAKAPAAAPAAMAQATDQPQLQLVSGGAVFKYPPLYATDTARDITASPVSASTLPAATAEYQLHRENLLQRSESRPSSHDSRPLRSLPGNRLELKQNKAPCESTPKRQQGSAIPSTGPAFVKRRRIMSPEAQDSTRSPSSSAHQPHSIYQRSQAKHGMEMVVAPYLADPSTIVVAVPSSIQRDANGRLATGGRSAPSRELANLNPNKAPSVNPLPSVSHQPGVPEVPRHAERQRRPPLRLRSGQVLGATAALNRIPQARATKIQLEPQVHAAADRAPGSLASLNHEIHHLSFPSLVSSPAQPVEPELSLRKDYPELSHLSDVEKQAYLAVKRDLLSRMDQLYEKKREIHKYAAAEKESAQRKLRSRPLGDRHSAREPDQFIRSMQEANNLALQMKRDEAIALLKEFPDED